MFRTLILTAATAAALLAGAPASARQDWKPEELGKETSIPFIAFRNLYNFEADSDRGVYLQDQSRRWYYARVIGPCTALPFAVKIGVDTRFNGDRLDRTGTLLVDRDRCPIDSLTASEGPPKKTKRKG
jgi:hypothetical protein